MSVPDLAAASPSLLQRLRAETSPAHRALDAALDFSPQSLDRARYAAFLLGTWLVVEQLEPALTELLGPTALPPPARSRRDVLADDLRALGVALPASTAHGTATPWLPRTVAAAWGAAYVVEGSSLGGLVLVKRVRDILGDQTARDGTGYLTLRGEHTKAAWAAFQSALASFDAHASVAHQREACASASATFDAYARAFRRSGAMVSALPVEGAS